MRCAECDAEDRTYSPGECESIHDNLYHSVKDDLEEKPITCIKHSWIMARGDMDEPLGYKICGVCGVSSIEDVLKWPIHVEPFYVPNDVPANQEHDPTEPFRIQESVALLGRTLKNKNEDYKVDTEFSNFEQAAEFAGISPFQVMLAQIGIKYTRVKGLQNFESTNYESLKDSLLDLAGYAIITHAYLEDF